MRHKTMRYSSIATVIAAAAMALSLAGCGSATSQAGEQSDGQAGESGTGGSQSEPDESEAADQLPADAEVTAVTITKSGGYAANSETLEIAEDGSWSYAKNRMAPQTGELAEDELTTVWESAGDDEIAAQGEEPKDNCADVPLYEIEIAYGDQDLTMQTDKCGTAPNTPFDEIVKTASDATPI